MHPEQQACFDELGSDLRDVAADPAVATAAIAALAGALTSRSSTARCGSARAVILAGPAANLILGVVLFAAAQFVGIKEIVPTLSQPPVGSMLADAGVRSGDRIVAAGEEDGGADAQVRWHDIRSFDGLIEGLAIALMDQKPLSLEVRHRGEQVTHTVTLPIDTLGKNELDLEAVTRIGLTSPYSPPVMGDILPDGPAAKAGLVTGDVVESVDGQAIVDSQALRDAIRADAASGTATTMQWHVLRHGQPLTIAVTPRVMAEEGKHFGRVDAGIGAFEQELVRDGLLDSMAYGARQAWGRATLSLRMFGRMLTGKASVKNLNGPITIADAAGKSASRGLADFLAFLAQVSVGIGVLNLLPIPVLDGGRLLYYLFEGATGRPVSTPWQTWLRYGGVFAILLLMSLALSNDLARLLGR